MVRRDTGSNGVVSPIRAPPLSGARHLTTFLTEGGSNITALGSRQFSNTMMSQTDDNPFLLDSETFAPGEVDSRASGVGPATWLGLAALVCVVGAVLFLSRGDSTAPPPRVSSVPAPSVNELRWTGPFEVASTQSISDIIVDGGIAYAVVDGWIATSSDLLQWDYINPPDAINHPPQHLMLSGSRTVVPAFAGHVIDFDVLDDVIIALVGPDAPPPDVTVCFELPTAPVMRLFVTFDGGSDWGEIPLNGLTRASDLFHAIGIGAVATNGITAAVSYSMLHRVQNECVRQRLNVDDEIIGLAPTQRAVIFRDGEQGTRSIPLEESVVSEDELEIVLTPRTDRRMLVITADYDSAPAVGNAGPLLEATRTEYVTGFEGVPIQISSNHGQSYVAVRRQTGYFVRDGVAIRPNGTGAELSADFGITWTAASEDFAHVIDTVDWNGTLFVAAPRAGSDADIGSLTLTSAVLGEDTIEVLTGLTLPGLEAVTVYDDKLAAFGTLVGPDGVTGSVVYFGERPLVIE